MKKKNRLILLVSFVIFIIILLIVFFLVVRIRENNKVKDKIVNITEQFYENSYYEITSKDTLKQLTDKGIIISLKELTEYEEVNTKDYVGYNLNKSKITIYPIKPYNKKDYKIDINLYRK